MKVRFDSLDPERGSRSFVFAGHRETIVAGEVDEVLPALMRIEGAIEAGRHAAGFIAYEAAPAFDAALAVRPPKEDLPLLVFGIFDERRAVTPLEGISATDEGFQLEPLAASIDPAAYAERVRHILDLIGAGDTYQVNYTFRLRGRFEGDPLELYGALCQAQRAAYCAYMEFSDRVLVSASPELFFRTHGAEIEMRPMKGTRPRGRWTAEDDAIAAALLDSPKEKAENLMIVDLLRNDLGRVAEFGTVSVPVLFHVESYPTVHQLTSTVRARLRAGVGLGDLFRALFPSGSVTGAPKIRTTEIIRDLEDSARGLYTGAIGFASPGEAVFSVAIRTLLLNRRTGDTEVGVGSGITADSEPMAEFRESMQKGAFLRHWPPPFRLLESLRLDRSGQFPLLAGHLDRMSDSARYFGFAFHESSFREALSDAAARVPPGTYKVRVTLDREGRIETDTVPIPDSQPTHRLRVASEPVDETDPFLFHKTTHRDAYRRAVGLAGCDDVILWNRRGELTETTRANLVLESRGVLLTPPIESGLLPGVMRASLIDQGRIEARVLTLADLDRADRIYLINAVRGWWDGILVDRDRVVSATATS